MKNEITRELIINTLQQKGYSATPNDVIKNGVTLKGINIRNESNITPVIYIDELLTIFDDINEIVEAIINTYEAHKSLDIDLSIFSNKEWVLAHTFIALQKSSNEQLIKKTCEFDGIEQYLYIRGNIGRDGWSVKLNHSIMENANLTLDEVWNAAQNNTFGNETVIKSMSSIMAEILDCPEFEGLENAFPMYVITNHSKTKGSSAILDIESIRKFFSSLDREYHQLVLIPSSIHECILVPVDDEIIDIDRFNNMVQEVNQNEVDETEQLGSHCYIISL